MEMVGLLLVFVGIMVSAAGTIWFLYVAFQESFLWLIGCIFIPFVPLIFLVLNWSDAKDPFVISLIGTAILAVGCLMGGIDFAEFAN